MLKRLKAIGAVGFKLLKCFTYSSATDNLNLHILVCVTEHVLSSISSALFHLQIQGKKLSSNSRLFLISVVNPRCCVMFSRSYD